MMREEIVFMPDELCVRVTSFGVRLKGQVKTGGVNSAGEKSKASKCRLKLY